jgi:foldase protein PrsA
MWQWNKRMLTSFILLLVALPLLLVGCNTQEKEEATKTENTGTETKSILPLDTKSTKVIGEYNGGKVTEGELNRFINILGFIDIQIGFALEDPEIQKQLKELKKGLLEQYAARKYILSKADPNSPSTKKIDEEMKTLEESVKNNIFSEENPKNLDEAIKGKGFTKADLRNYILEQMRIKDYIDEKMKGKTYQHVKVNHILISTTADSNRTDAEAKKRADEVKSKLAKGEDFAKLAKEYSDDTGSKENGGLVEGSVDQFVTEFANAAKTLPLNQVSDPIKTEYGYHVMKVVARGEQPIEKASEEVKSLQENQIFMEILEKEAKVKSLL